MADYYFFRNAFTDEEIERIKKIAIKYPATEAATGQEASSKQKDSVRKSTVRWLYDDIGELDWVYE
ncbi:MAG TPA: hypothetical protein DCX27_21230, partial [Balneola sp.]|nr:hypothetical protein [Balneola sp.]